MEIPTNLREVADRIHKDGESHTETVRTLLSWFGQQRRGRWVVSRMRSAFREVGLVADPDFATAYIDGTVVLRAAGASNEGVAAGGGVSGHEADDPDRTDPVARLRMLSAANTKPETIPRDKPVTEAITVMLMNDFSQLPVMSNERDVDGMISWKSIGRAMALKRPCDYVRECMDRRVEVLPADVPLLDAIPAIVQHEVVLVKASGSDRRIVGLVTTSDVSLQFQELAEPFLLVGEIENHLRRLIDSEFTAEELAEFRDPRDEEREVEGVEDLTFGEYERVLQNRGNWDRLNLGLERLPVVERLRQVRAIRNDVMHFNPDGVTRENLSFLRDTVSFLQRV